MPKQLRSKNHAKYNINYHLILICKYRKKWIYNKIKARLIDLLNVKAKLLKINIIDINGINDHLHLFIRSSPEILISNIVKELKGYSSYFIRKEFNFLKKYSAFWSAGYFIETIGHISEPTILKYIKNQDKAINEN